MRPRLRRAALALVVLGVTGIGVAAGPLHRELQVLEDLDLARSSTDAAARRAAYLRLLERAPARLFADLAEVPGQRVVLMTGDYIRSDRPETSIVPELSDLEATRRIARTWSDACLADEGLARRTGAMLATLVGKGASDPAECLALNLNRLSERGLRRASFLWLVEQAGFPEDFDWRAPNDAEVALQRRSPWRPPAEVVARDRLVQEWISERHRRRRKALGSTAGSR